MCFINLTVADIWDSFRYRVNAGVSKKYNCRNQSFNGNISSESWNNGRRIRN